MKTSWFLFVACVLTGCSSLGAAGGSADRSARPEAVAPRTVIDAEGRPVTVLPPAGNLSTAVLPDGRHVPALVEGQSVILLNP